MQLHGSVSDVSEEDGSEQQLHNQRCTSPSLQILGVLWVRQPDLIPMAMSTILHVGSDICQRIPVMRIASFAVVQSEDSVPAIRSVFAGGDAFSAITFDADISAPSKGVLSAARSLSAVPFVLFENPSICYERSYFDIVIPTLTHPGIWLKRLNDVVEASREQRERSRRLRQECANSLSAFLETRALNRILLNPIDLALWRGGDDDSPKTHGSRHTDLTSKCDGDHIARF